MSDYDEDLNYYAAIYREQGRTEDEALQMAKDLMYAVGITE